MYKSYTTFEYNCENESGRLLIAKKIIKYIWLDLYPCIMIADNQIAINSNFFQVLAAKTSKLLIWMFNSLLVKLSKQILDC